MTNSVTLDAKAFADGVRRHEHALLVYHDGSERADAIRAYVQGGLDANERVILVIHPETPERFLELLSDVPGAVDAVSAGRLLVFPGASFHGSLGTPTRASLATLHGQLVEQAKKDGFAGIRAAVDVSYYVEAGGGADALLAFEDAIGERFPFEFRLLCLMNGNAVERAGLPRALLEKERQAHGRAIGDIPPAGTTT